MAIPQQASIMKYVLSYPLSLQDGVQSVSLPTGAKVLAVQVMDLYNLALWVLTDSEGPVVARQFKVITDGPIATTAQYVGSVVVGNVTYHVFAL